MNLGFVMNEWRKKDTLWQAIITYTHCRHHCCNCHLGAVVQSTLGRCRDNHSASCSLHFRHLHRTLPHPQMTRPPTTAPLLSHCIITTMWIMNQRSEVNE